MPQASTPQDFRVFVPRLQLPSRWTPHQGTGTEPATELGCTQCIPVIPWLDQCLAMPMAIDPLGPPRVCEGNHPRQGTTSNLSPQLRSAMELGGDDLSGRRLFSWESNAVAQVPNN